LLAGCTNCDEFAGFDAWHTMIVADASAAAAYQQRGVAAPNCNIKGAERPAASSGNPAAYADPNLLEVARLELERDCYKDAEQSLRERLKRLEDSTIGY
jgi:predicted negative regulator of RcsB-dependent stress response